MSPGCADRCVVAEGSNSFGILRRSVCEGLDALPDPWRVEPRNGVWLVTGRLGDLEAPSGVLDLMSSFVSRLKTEWQMGQPWLRLTKNAGTRTPYGTKNAGPSKRGRAGNKKHWPDGVQG